MKFKFIIMFFLILVLCNCIVNADENEVKNNWRDYSFYIKEKDNIIYCSDSKMYISDDIDVYLSDKKIYKFVNNVLVASIEFPRLGQILENNCDIKFKVIEFNYYVKEKDNIIYCSDSKMYISDDIDVYLSDKKIYKFVNNVLVASIKFPKLVKIYSSNFNVMKGDEVFFLRPKKSLAEMFQETNPLMIVKSLPVVIVMITLVSLIAFRKCWVFLIRSLKVSS